MLLAVLGIRIVEVPAIINLTTAGLRAWRLARVSALVKDVGTFSLELGSRYCIFIFLCVDDMQFPNTNASYYDDDNE